MSTSTSSLIDPNEDNGAEEQTISFYRSELAYTLAPMTSDNFTDDMELSFLNITISVVDSVNFTSDMVKITSIEQTAISSGNTTTPTNETLARFLQTESNTTATTSIDITLQLGQTVECFEVEGWAIQLSDADLWTKLIESNITVDYINVKPYLVMSYDSMGVKLNTASSCDVLINMGDTAVLSSVSNALNTEAKSAIIATAVFLGIILCLLCGKLWDRRVKRTKRAIRANQSEPSTKDKDDLIESGSLEFTAKETYRDKDWAVVDLSSVPPDSLNRKQKQELHVTVNFSPLKVLTLESTFCNAQAKECLRIFMGKRQMVEAFLFYEKMTDQILRPHPSGSHQAGLFKQLVIDEYIRVGSIHQLNISELLRRRTVRDTSTDLASLVPVIKEVHKLIITDLWTDWIDSDEFRELIESTEMQFSNFSYVADSQSQLDKAARTKVGEFVHRLCDTYDDCRIGHTSSWQGMTLQCPLWGNIFFADDDTIMAATYHVPK